MPPAISDDESDGVPDVIPAKKPTKKAIEEEEVEDAEDGAAEDEDEDDDEEAEEYVVEQIMGHDFLADGSVVYQIKWMGYEKKSDRTWEPAENLETAQQMLDDYHTSIGGVPTKPAKKGKKGKRSATEAFDSPAPAASSGKKRGRKSETNGDAENGVTPRKTKRQLPEGSWEDDIAVVSSILEEARNEKTARGKAKPTRVLIALVDWNDGRAKTQHPLEVLRTKAPQKLLDYYEQHLVFTPATDADEIIDEMMEE